MATLRIDRFTVDPADTEQLLARRNALVAAVRDAVPGLMEARLVKLEDGSWIDMWRWDSAASQQAAVAAAPAIPEAAAAFSLVGNLTSELAEVVDER
jgi:Antibiotic biosynthesis monooxygenase